MNSVDFLKSCSTNVRVVENLLQTKHTRFATQEPELGGSIPSIVADLRRQNVLCEGSKHELWVFGEPEDGTLHHLEWHGGGLKIQDSSDDCMDTTTRNADGQLIRDVLLGAIEGSITFSLASEHHVRHVGYFCWLFDQISEDLEGAGGESILVRLHPKITEHGTLYISTTTHSVNVDSLLDSEARRDRKLILAPSGLTARMPPVGSREDHGTKQHIGGTSWKTHVAEALKSECIDIGPNEEWMLVEISGNGNAESFIWPVSLCLAVKSHSQSRSSTSSAASNWRWWFEGSNEFYEDPLRAAEEWFVNSTARQRAGASDETVAEPAHDPATVGTMSETPLATSPPFNQRLMDQQSAFAGIYPTPPDGLIPGHATQHTTSDAMSSAMQVDSSESNPGLPLPGGEDGVSRDTSMGSNEAQGYQPNSDDLFGDMGEMEFGANEVGDADFDYFDEPDDLPHDEADVQDTEMVEDVPLLDDDQFSKHEESQWANAEDMDRADQGVSAISHPISNENAVLEELKHDEPLSAGQERAPSPSNMDDVHKPLSPFGIRERLLPPPIPASAAGHTDPHTQNPRSSTFDPVSFNENLSLSSKYANVFERSIMVPSSGVPDISLPGKRKKHRTQPTADLDSGATDLESSSDDDSDESTSATSDGEDLPPRLPWDTKKRKRTSFHDQISPLPGGADRMWTDEGINVPRNEDIGEERMTNILGSLINRGPAFDSALLDKERGPAASTNSTSTDVAGVPSVEEHLELNPLDLVYVAQIVCEQANSVVPDLLNSVNTYNSNADESTKATESAIRAIAEDAIEHALPHVNECTLAQLALVREPPPRPMPNPGKAPQSGPQRLPQREGSMQLGPDHFPIPPPYVRIQRGADTWEMLPPAINFWAALGLGPANGGKDVMAISILPQNDDLAGSVQGFVAELGHVYESYKLGSFVIGSENDDDLLTLENYNEGALLVSVDDEPFSFVAVIKAYASACAKLGESLARIGHVDPDRTIVVYIINPFEGDRPKHYLCACFWQLYRAYRQHSPKTHQKSPRSDIVLQILPVNLLASLDGLVLLESQQFGVLAMEVYDRCPPSSKAAAVLDMASALPIPAAPAVELAVLPPKRIAFQLTADPPGDLLHEGSILHLAYAVSTDRQWITVCWIDNTGRYQTQWTTCLRGRSFQDAAAEVWEKTFDIMSAREVIWRIFIVTDRDVDPSIQQCWKELARSKGRKQVLHVTLLSSHPDAPVQLMPPPATDGISTGIVTSGQGGGFLTPALTPQGSNATVSPDASGHAPPTPAPSDAMSTATENDADAHIVDVTDETWGVLLTPAFASGIPPDPPSTASSTTCASHGALFKRGEAQSPSAPLEALGVSLHWDVRVRPGGILDEGPVRQTEATLREVLRMYRHLGLLGRLRKLGSCEDASEGGGKESGSVPVHIVCAVSSAEALNGFLQ